MNTEIWMPPLLLERWSEGGFLLAVFGRVLDGLSGLAGIFIKYLYAGCGTSLKSYSTPVYRKFEKPVPTPTTRQAFRCRFMLLSWFFSVNQVSMIFLPFSLIFAWGLCLKAFSHAFSCWFYICLHLHIFVKKRTYVLVQMHLCFSSNALAFWFKRTCVLGWMHLRFRESGITIDDDASHRYFCCIVIQQNPV